MHGFGSGDETKAGGVLAPKIWLVASKRRLTCINWGLMVQAVYSHSSTRTLKIPNQESSHSHHTNTSEFSSNLQRAHEEPVWGPAPRI